MKARIADLGYTVFESSTTDFNTFVAAFTEKWAKVIKFSGAKIYRSACCSGNLVSILFYFADIDLELQRDMPRSFERQRQCSWFKLEWGTA